MFGSSTKRNDNPAVVDQMGVGLFNRLDDAGFERADELGLGRQP